LIEVVAIKIGNRCVPLAPPIQTIPRPAWPTSHSLGIKLHRFICVARRLGELRLFTHLAREFDEAIQIVEPFSLVQDRVICPG
jgi:hypothetical protein